MGEVEEGHGTVPVQALGDELPALVQGGPGLPLGGDFQHLPLETASPGQGEGAAAQHQAPPACPAPGAGVT